MKTKIGKEKAKSLCLLMVGSPCVWGLVSLQWVLGMLDNQIKSLETKI